MNELIRSIEAEQLRTDLADFKVGNTVKVHVKIKEVTEKEFRFLKELF